jgi:hypothetical protein
LAPGLSILLTATIIGTLAALAWLIASTVWGMTPSSAATTRMTMSVIGRRANAWPKRLRGPAYPEKAMSPFSVDQVGADVLGNAAGFARGDPRVADDIEQGGFAVIDMAHDGDHRRPVASSFCGIVRLGGLQNGLLFEGGPFHLVVEFGRPPGLAVSKSMV